MAATAEESAKADVPAKPSLWRRATLFARLLVYSNPSTTDLLVLFIGFIAAIAAGVPFPIMSIVFGELVNGLDSASCEVSATTAGAYQAGLNHKILLIVYVGIAYFGLIYIYSLCWNLSGERLAQRLRDRYFSSILRQDAEFFSKLSAGEVSARITGDIAVEQQGTNEKVGIVINSVAFFITAYVVAFIKDARLAGILVSLTPAYLLMALSGGFFVQKYFGSALESMGKASSVALEAFSNTMVVHAFSANARLEEKFVQLLHPALRAGVYKSVAMATQAGLLYFIAFSANGLAFWQGSAQIANAVESSGGGISVGNIFTVILILVDASLILSQAAPFLRSFDAAAVAFRKLEADIDHRSTIDGTTEHTGRSLPEITGTVELHNVSFAYPSQPDRPVLQDLSFICPAGQQTAIVGLSGSGKSTVAGLITRFYNVNQGSVLLDGHDIMELNVRSVRSHLSLVQQEPYLLDRSILENIALGLVNSPAHAYLRPLLMGTGLAEIAAAVRDGQELVTAALAHSDHAREIVSLVLHAAQLADANGFIERLQEGYGTMVGAKGNLISGGQKQRISLARSLVKDPRILILDEATASLDSATERRIQQALDKVAVGRTVITIAHRLATIKNADNIILMRQGRLIEQGTHQNLLAANGAYAELVRLQNLNVHGGEEGESDTACSTASSNGVQKPETATLDVLTEVEKPALVQAVEESKNGPEEEENQTASSTLSSLGSLFRPHLFALVLALTGAVVIGGTYCGSAIIFGNVVSKLSGCEEPADIRHAGHLFGLLFFMLAIIEFLANFISWSLFGWIAEQIIYKVRVLSLRTILEQDLAWHESKDHNPSMLLGLITKDSSALGGLTGSVVCTILSTLVSLVATITMTHIIAWKIALVCLSVVPLLLGAGWMRVTTLAAFEERHLEAFAHSNAITVEAVNSIKTVMSLSLEHEVLETYRRSLQAPMRQVTGYSAWANLWLAVGYGLSNFLYALAYWWGSKQIIAGEYTQQQFFIVQLALLVSSQLWGQMFALVPEVSRAFSATRRLLNLLDQGSTRDLAAPLQGQGDLESSSSEKGPASTNTTGISVAFKQVHFSYPARPDTTVLHGLDLSIRAGQFAALVGPSGAGKSTIISLVERLYRPTSGTVEVDGMDIAYGDSNGAFRHQIAYVPQQSAMFEGTVRFNLMLGARPGQTPTQAELEDACRLANIHDTIMQLPDGYNTDCGPNGDRLSDGQKQRLAIARALVRKPQLLLLDESTSALDAESERLLQEGLDQARKVMTVIAIAHRLYTIRKANVIFMIENGQCVDRGTHAELVERSESYRVNALNQAVGE
ncbi:putative ABC multidrug transporter [Aspergillus sclerotioniger CBS 115572]|uniref:Putative ABC multidrug transporter n=1 Tax=Aspergillus sclerotioniger CBS 115572 TaxID=1450535 RepID=A0A317XBT1_9EURO|nr:putative ABC multidrug transporter [Aspergillus sclerotioniger CBS 115572]PWY96094.1 putative ABC multidrug transporter [Aspergillus sclerotioniger CBS 115572]